MSGTVKLMNRDILTDWLAGLRSGRYEQAIGSLTRVDGDGSVTGFCCLGVLCDQAVRMGAPVTVTPNAEYGDVEYGGCADHLPPEVCAWAGLTNSDGDHLRDIPVPVGVAIRHGVDEDVVRRCVRAYEPDFIRVSCLNDSGVPFAVIADILEDVLS